MARANFANCMAVIFPFEGGYGNTPKDRGNWTSGKIGVGECKGTKYGIAAMAYPDLDIKNLTKPEATAIYARDYAPKVAFDLQPPGVDLVVLDVCINSGPGRALQFQRKAIGAVQGSPFALATQAVHIPDKAGLVKNICAQRGSFYQGISTFETFGKGWMRRNAAMEAQGVRMVLSADQKAPDQIKDLLEREQAEAAAAKKKNGAGAATTGAGGTAAGNDASTTPAAPTTPKIDPNVNPVPDLSQLPLPTAHGFDWLFWGEVVAVVGLAALTGWLIFHAIRHHARAKAYAAAAAGTITV